MPARILPALAGLLASGTLLASLTGCTISGAAGAAPYPAQPGTAGTGAATAAATAAVTAVARLGSGYRPDSGTAVSQFAGP